MGTPWLFGYGDGVRVTEQDVKSRPRHVPLVVGYGGGVDSTSMLVAMMFKNIRPDCIIFADVAPVDPEKLGEKPETYAFIKEVDAWLQRHDWPALTIVGTNSSKAGDVSLYARCIRNKTIPSRAFGLSACSFAWKIEPQEKWTNHWPHAKECWAAGDKIIKALGYDAGEERRATVHSDEKYRYWYPLQEWALDRDDCLSLIKSAGLPRPPKSSCFFCPSSKVEEVVWLHDNHPALYQKAAEMEALAQSTGELGTVVGLGRSWAWQDVIKMTREARAKLPQPAPGCVICEDGSCPTEDE